ncbi:MAG: HEAT repeat domain-containing protein [Gemmatimonadota bacterium]
MTLSKALPAAFIIIGLAGTLSLVVMAAAKVLRARGSDAAGALFAPYRNALIVMASGEDDDGHAKVALSSVGALTWACLRPKVLSLLPKVRGGAAEDLSDLLRLHGDIDNAQGMLTARSAVRRARAAYLLGLVRDPENVLIVMPLLRDPDADVRRVAARALGFIADPSAASGILDAVRTQQGRIGLPDWVAAEALLAMGAGITEALKDGLTSLDHGVRSVCVMVAGYGTFASVVPELRILLATDTEPDVRAGATVALGLIGSADDVATLAWLTHASETTVLRRSAATALGDLGSPEGLETLLGLLGDADSRLAQLAADSMVTIGSEGIARLREAVYEQSAGARVAAAALDLAGLRGRLTPVAVGA